MKKFQEINIFFAGGTTEALVGTLAIADHKVLFEYDLAWIQKGIELSPRHLPTRQTTFQFDSSKLVNALPGLCADSLPDGWGMLIMDRFLLKNGVKRQDISPIDRLAYLGNNAMGALCYRPSLDRDDQIMEAVSIGATAREALDLYEGNIADASRLLVKIGGSPGGARPKALIGISDCGTQFVSGLGELPDNFSHWLLKFSGSTPTPLRELGPYEGVIEYIYLKMAEDSGIMVPDYRLITDDVGVQHIAVRRFDKPTSSSRAHIATAAGLLHADPGTPSLDYTDLIKWAWVVTKDSTNVEEQFRRAVFNYYAVNRDDHAKNHGYLMKANGSWQLSPAYDLTYSSGPGGEHWTSYLGEGKQVSEAALLKLAHIGSINEKNASRIIERVRIAVGQFQPLCKKFEVPTKYSSPIIAEMLER